jgi:hypothetical protein
MHYANVTCKELPMNTVLLEHYRTNPALRRRLIEAAHRERARTVEAGLAWLLGRIAESLLPRRSTARWLARLG